MSEQIELRVVIDPSLVKYFEEGMSKNHIDCSTATETAEPLATILNDTMYPIVTDMTSEQEIHPGYRPRSFADPIF